MSDGFSIADWSECPTGRSISRLDGELVPLNLETLYWGAFIETIKNRIGRLSPRPTGIQALIGIPDESKFKYPEHSSPELVTKAVEEVVKDFRRAWPVPSLSNTESIIEENLKCSLDNGASKFDAFQSEMGPWVFKRPVNNLRDMVFIMSDVHFGRYTMDQDLETTFSGCYVPYDKDEQFKKWLEIGADIASRRDEIMQAGGYKLPVRLGGRFIPYSELESVLEAMSAKGN